MLAEALGNRLGYRAIDRDQLIQKAAAWGGSQADLRIAIEKPPTLFGGQSQHTKYVYLAFIQAALTDEVRTGNVIYHGLAGHLLLGTGPHILRTRIIAPMTFRIAKVQDRLKFNREEAVAYIEKMDEDRRKWTQLLYSVDWEDASLYDVVVNLEQMNIEEACAVICAVSQQRSFAATPETQKAIDDLALASRVKASLAMNSATSQLEFDVGAEGGSVSIKGDTVRPDQVRKIAGIVQAVPGVSQVQFHHGLGHPLFKPI